MAMLPAGPASLSTSSVLTARALVVGERVETARLERRDTLSTAPLSFRRGDGLVVVFRYGVVVMIGLDPLAEEEVLRGIQTHVHGERTDREEETIQLATLDDR